MCMELTFQQTWTRPLVLLRASSSCITAMLRRQTVWRLGFGSAAAALSASLPVRISRHTCLIDFVRLGVQEVLFSFGFYKTGMI